MSHATNGHEHTDSAAASGAARCPTCGSRLTRERYERILRITEARRKQLAAERAAVVREREAIARERTSIERGGAAVERAKWEREMGVAARKIKRLCADAVAGRKAALAHEKQVQTEIRKREALEKQLTRQLATVQAKTRAAVETRIRNASLAADERHQRAVARLQEQLRTLGERRRRDEEHWKHTVAELQQKAESRDRAHFGDEGEEDLVAGLRAAFPGDRIERRGKGGDVLHAVIDAGRVVGTILYENKNRSGWQRAYLRQTKDAMETHGTRYGVLVTRTMPAHRSGLCVIGGVIVVVPALATQVVAVLREGIVAIERLRLSEQGKETKAGALLEYVRSQEFAGAIHRVQEKVANLREALWRERSSHDGWWRAREQDYAAVLRAATGIDARVVELLGTNGVKANGAPSSKGNGTKVNDAHIACRTTPPQPGGAAQQ